MENEMTSTIKPPLFTQSILNNHATDHNYYTLNLGTNGKYRVNKLSDIPESWRDEERPWTHCWITLSIKSEYEEALAYMLALP